MRIETYFDFCSGIGGGKLGLEKCGLKCVGYSDTSRLSVRTYNLMHNSFEEKNYGNLKKIKCDTLPHFDLLIAGFPCQTFSVIGRKAGFSDDRGQIIFHLIRILNETRPKSFILENVKGLVSHDKGETIKIILNELKAIGYEVTYKVLSSIEYGVPQMRQRVYFVGFDKRLNINIDDFEWPKQLPKPSLSNFLIDQANDISEENYDRLVRYLNNPTNCGKYSPKDFLNEEYLIIDTRMSDLRLYRERVPTLRSHRDGIFYVKDGKIKELTGYEALLLQGFSIEYANRVKDLVSNRHLLMQAGNAMTVNVINEIGKSIMKIQGGSAMENWNQFEESCYEYLSREYTNTSFEKMGGSDSTIPDIHVTTEKGTSFFIEAKMAKAQCGQFVLLANSASEIFEYSSKNKYGLNKYSIKIMDYMNENFDIYINAGSAGRNLNMDTEIFSNWIKDYYASKGVKYFITQDNDFIIIPLSKFSEYFSVSATYRMKKSGSADPSSSNQQEVARILEAKGIQFRIRNIGKTTIVETNIDLADKQISGSKYNYLFRLEGPNRYKVRQLSNTCNSNVIFSISLKSNQMKLDLNEFESEL